MSDFPFPRLGATPAFTTPDELPESAFVRGVPDAPVSTQRPLYLVRTRLQERGLWPAMVQALMSQPEQLLRLLSAEQTGMVDTTDADTIRAIRAIGGDPAEILA